MAVTAFHDLPLADRDRQWDGGAAEKRVRKWAGAQDEPNAKYRDAHLWYDGEKPDDHAQYGDPLEIPQQDDEQAPDQQPVVSSLRDRDRSGDQQPQAERDPSGARCRRRLPTGPCCRRGLSPAPGHGADALVPGVSPGN